MSSILSGIASIAIASGVALVGAGSAGAAVPEDCSAGMVGYWTFDDGGGTTAADCYDGNPGALGNGPVWTTGRVDGALRFDGVDDNVRIPHSPSLDVDAITIEVWAKLDAPPFENGKLVLRDNVGEARLWQLTVNADGTLRFIASTTSNLWDIDILTRNAITPGRWYHIVATVDAANRADLWVNRLLWGSDDTFTGSLAKGICDMEIGSFGGRWALDGIIDEVALYDRALTVEEIWRHYYNGLADKGYCELPGPIPAPVCGDGFVEGEEECDDLNTTEGDGCSGACAVEPGYNCNGQPSACIADAVDACDNPHAPPGLVSYWAFEEGEGAAAGDSYGANPGALLNGPVWTTGLVGGALSFDGVNDHVEIPHSPSLDVDDITIELWARLDAIPPSSNRKLVIRDSGSEARIWQLAVAAPGKLQFIASTSGAWDIQILTGNKISPDEWYHIVATFDTANGAKVWVNGADWGSDNTFTGPLVKGICDIEIGAYGGRWAIDGVLDEVAIYDRALSAEEIQAHYEDGLAEKGYCAPACADEDQDGYGLDGEEGCPHPGEIDCDDSVPAVNPGAAETCNGADDDCDGIIDDGCAPGAGPGGEGPPGPDGEGPPGIEKASGPDGEGPPGLRSPPPGRSGTPPGRAFLDEASRLDSVVERWNGIDLEPPGDWAAA
ncbi:MAG: LamG-like jellyroll fold domain-containing protein [Elusimicrobiota bacterium]